MPLTCLKTLLEAVEVGGAARHAVNAHLVDAAPLHFADARADYERNVALLSSAKNIHSVINLRPYILRIVTASL